MAALTDEVFYIDDSPDDRLFAEHSHQRGKYAFDLRVFSTGFSAILDIERRAAKGQTLPRLIVADHYMPVMDGPELLRLIRANPAFSGITLAVCSGSDDPADVSHARDAGARLILNKPLDLDLCSEALSASHPGDA